MAIRRTISIDEDQEVARSASRLAAEALRGVLAHDPRVTSHPLPDAPGPTHSFSVGEDEFIAGTPESVANQIVTQCRAVGAGHFLANFGRRKSLDALRRSYELFGGRVVPLLRAARL